jgi:hypothetical protein
MNAHYASCQGRPVEQTPQQAYQYPQPRVQTPQMYIPPPIPKHNHNWFENDTYKVCLDQSCKEIKPKLKGSWMIFTRYALKIFVIELIIAFAIAFAATSALGVRR